MIQVGLIFVSAVGVVTSVVGSWDVGMEYA